MTDNTSDGRTEDETDDSAGPTVPPDLESDQSDGPALSPEELDIADSEYVEKLDDNGRYVVSPGGGPPKVPDSISGSGPSGGRETGSRDERTDPGGHSALGGDSPSTRPVSPEAARTLLAEELSRANARYGLDIVANFEGETVRHRTVSDDVITTFENLLRWYAQHVTDGTPADEVVEILLGESTFQTGETSNLAGLLEEYDLDRTDSIADLVVAIRDDAGRI